MGSYVGIDLHRRRSVVVVLNEDGNRVSWSRIDNTPANLAAEIVAAGGRAASSDNLSSQIRWRVVNPTPRHPMAVLVQHDHHRPTPVKINPYVRSHLSLLRSRVG